MQPHLPGGDADRQQSTTIAVLIAGTRDASLPGMHGREHHRGLPPVMRRVASLGFVLATLFVAAVATARVDPAERLALARHRGTPILTRGNPLAALPKPRGERLVIGVMGSAAAEATIPAEVHGRLQRLGAAIARQGAVLLTGACGGMPQVTVRAARKAGGTTVGVTAAKTLQEHATTFRNPVDSLDVLQLTGAGAGMGLIAREKNNIRLSDIIVFAGGRSGTLGELLFAMHERKVVALLEDSTGVTAEARGKILPHIGRGKATIVSDRDPEKLIAKAVKAAARLERGGTATGAPRASSLSRLAVALRQQGKFARAPLDTAKLAQDHNIYSFFGTTRGMSAADRANVDVLIDRIAKGRPGNRSPLLMLPTRRGLASQVARAARARGVQTIGVSPAGSVEEHVRDKQFTAGLDRVQLTGEGLGVGQVATYQHAIKNADVVFVAGGDYQTLGGTIFAMYEPTVVAVLETGGMTGKLRKEILGTFNKTTAAKMVFDSDPDRLYRRAVATAAYLRRTTQQEYVGSE